MVKVIARANQITSVIINFKSANLEEVGVSLRFVDECIQRNYQRETREVVHFVIT